LMLLPHWTDGCIGSMEGLFFEASATTPFHFLMQSELSAAPSRAQRDLPYSDLDLDLGVGHLQMMGVRYYMATSVEATTAAADHGDLTRVATSGPWTIYEVAGSEVVEPLQWQPVVIDGADHGQHEWICGTEDSAGRCQGPAIRWFNDPGRWDVMHASSGPDPWQRIDPALERSWLGKFLEAPGRRALPDVEVTDIEITDHRISFEVDRPGVPVLVKSSYFPNWRARGADGPYRVAPNLMVVVPDSEQVELGFGREPVDWLAWAATLLGVVLLVIVARRRPLPPDPAEQAGSSPTGGPAEPAGPSRPGV
jgi:hypothetical protein